ncbi:MAG: hypothetical protein LBS26_02435 [Campylobacteraceae bacterium]|jgi:hypothetical protein|nr:hypothetical protein [Campylobacteraceae bacterium]
MNNKAYWEITSDKFCFLTVKHVETGELFIFRLVKNNDFYYVEFFGTKIRASANYKSPRTALTSFEALINTFSLEELKRELGVREQNGH